MPGLRHLLGCISVHSKSPTCTSNPALCSSSPEKQQLMVPVIGPLTPLHETWLEFQVLGFGLVQPYLVQSFNEGVNQQRKIYVCVSFSPCLSTFQINKCIYKYFLKKCLPFDQAGIPKGDRKPHMS